MRLVKVSIWELTDQELDDVIETTRSPNDVRGPVLTLSSGEY